MLDEYVFEAIDMPLDISTQLIINKLNVFIEVMVEILRI